MRGAVVLREVPRGVDYGRGHLWLRVLLLMREREEVEGGREEGGKWSRGGGERGRLGRGAGSTLFFVWFWGAGGKNFISL